jgi:hypothetical protein
MRRGFSTYSGLGKSAKPKHGVPNSCMGWMVDFFLLLELFSKSWCELGSRLR